jgi:hypothetical protein
MTTRKLRILVIVVGAFVICQPAFAAENWPDSIDQ